jgi:hypothetical protein
LRDVHFCKTCDFRLPFCVRTDREFCGKRCRVWWYRHPGVKRLDFSPGEDIPSRRRRGQPKTLAEALMLLAQERTRADELEAAAKQAQTSEGVLRNQLTTLRDELSEERTKNATLRDELETNAGSTPRRSCSVGRKRTAPTRWRRDTTASLTT